MSTHWLLWFYPISHSYPMVPVLIGHIYVFNKPFSENVSFFLYEVLRVAATKIMCVCVFLVQACLVEVFLCSLYG